MYVHNLASFVPYNFDLHLQTYGNCGICRPTANVDEVEPVVADMPLTGNVFILLPLNNALCSFTGLFAL